MHSSRMRTARALTIGRGGTCPGGYLPGGCICPGGCTCQGVYLHVGVYLPRGVYMPRGCTCPGGCTCRGTPPVNRMTDRCKNITLPQTSFAGGNNAIISMFCVIVQISMNAKLELMPVIQMLSAQMYLETTPVNATLVMCYL